MVWTANDAAQANEAARDLEVWPLDDYNAALLNQVHPRDYVQSCDAPHPVYDLIAIGAGAGGLVSSKQVSGIEQHEKEMYHEKQKRDTSCIVPYVAVPLTTHDSLVSSLLLLRIF